MQYKSVMEVYFQFLLTRMGPRLCKVLLVVAVVVFFFNKVKTIYNTDLRNSCSKKGK